MSKNVPADYQRRHRRVRVIRGKASTHPCAHCSERGIAKPARDWATLHGATGEDPTADYIALCRSCHLTYDGAIRRFRTPSALANLAIGQRRKRLTPQHRAKIGAAMVGNRNRSGGKRRKP